MSYVYLLFFHVTFSQLYRQILGTFQLLQLLFRMTIWRQLDCQDFRFFLKKSDLQCILPVRIGPDQSCWMQKKKKKCKQRAWQWVPLVATTFFQSWWTLKLKLSHGSCKMSCVGAVRWTAPCDWEKKTLLHYCGSNNWMNWRDENKSKVNFLCRDSQHVGLKSLHCNLQVRHSLYVPFQTLMCICITLMVGPQRAMGWAGALCRGKQSLEEPEERGGRRVKMQRRSRMRRVLRREGEKKKEGRRGEVKRAGQTRTEGCREEKSCHFSPCQRSHLCIRRIQVKNPNQTNRNLETDTETCEECRPVHNWKCGKVKKWGKWGWKSVVMLRRLHKNTSQAPQGFTWSFPLKDDFSLLSSQFPNPLWLSLIFILLKHTHTHSCWHRQHLINQLILLQ